LCRLRVIMSEDTQSRLSLREEQKNLTRQRLLAATEEVLAKRGYHAATVDEIAEAAGVSRATFYLHFDNKQEALRSLVRHYSPIIRESFQALERVLVSRSRDELRAWLDEGLAFQEEHERQMLATREAMMSDAELGHELAVSSLTAAEEGIADYLALWPEEQREAVKLRVALLRVQFEALFLHRLIWRSWPIGDRDLLLDTLCDEWMAFLGPPPHDRSWRKYTTGSRAG
jgi:AcrR family transcriptional regulator